MKILIIHPFFKTHYKGIIYSHLARLVNLEKGVSLKVLQVFLSEKSRENMETFDTSLHQYDYEILFKKADSEVSFSQRIRKIFGSIKKEKPDVINTTGYYDLAVLLPVLWFRLRGVPVIMSIDSTLSDKENNLISLYLKKWIFAQIDGFFSYGTKSSELIKFYSQKSPKIFLENNAVDNDRLYASFQNSKHQKSRHNFIFVGRFIKEKNLTTLIQAFSEIETEGWGLILAGTGPEEIYLKNQAKEIANVDFLPPVPWFEVPQLLSMADVFVLPSISEPWGLVVNEAMVCAMPVLVSKNCGSAHDLVVQSVNGFTFAPESVDQLKEHMIWFINNQDKINKMGQESQKIIATHTPEILAKQMFDAFKTFKK